MRVRLHPSRIQRPPGPLLVVANHQSWLDGPLLATLLPFPVVIAVAPEENRGPLRWLLEFFPHVVIDHAEPFSVKRLASLIGKGSAVLVFPEGRVTRTGSLTKLYDTATLAALKAGASILPVAIDGLATSRFGETPGHRAGSWRPRVHVNVRQPERVTAPNGGSLRVRRQRAALDMQRMIQAATASLPFSRTLVEALLDAATNFGRGTPILEENRQPPRTYGDLLKGSFALARIGQRISRQGDTVGILLPNATVTVLLLFGLWAVGRVPAMLNFTAGRSAMQAACRAAKIRLVITSRRFVDALAEQGIRLELGAVEIVYVEDLRLQLTLADKLWLLARALPNPRKVLVAQEPTAPAVILFTSGSEGVPKGVALSHAAILANIAQMRSVIDFTSADKFLNALPMYHSYGLTACALMPLLTGTKVLLYPTPLHYRVIPELAYANECTFLFGTSTFLGHYARHAHPYDFHRIRVVVSGAEKLDDAVAGTWLRKFGLRITEGYGATECAPVLALNAPLAYKAGSVGRLLPNIEHRILPVPGIASGGELHVRCPNLMLGYLLPEDPGTIKPPASEVGVGWYATGDLVDMDEEGFLWVRGRLKRFAKIAGEMVSLDAVERVARHASPEHQHAASVQVVADLGESTVLFTTDASLTRGALHQSARKLGSHELAVSRSVVYVKELPMLGSGKTDYVALQALLSSESRPFVDRQLEARPLVSLGPAVPGAEAGIQGV
jgi:acyl-[acyl-carrier-protein]-phospholipid O-acyltransferase/long-chain-fatty-acid--[acyl-carrier-protein] ligase